MSWNQWHDPGSSCRLNGLMIHDRGTHRVDILRVVEIDEPELPEPAAGSNGN
jgi:hypothetical protein